MGRSQGGEVRASVVSATMLAVVILAACAPSGDGAGASKDALVDTSMDPSDAHAPTESVTETGATGAAQETTTMETGAEETSTVETTAMETTDAAEETSEVEPSSTQTETAAPGDVIVVSDFTTFTTPARAAYCIISAPTSDMAASISCEVAQTSVPPGEPLIGVCDAEGIGWFFNFFADSGHGGFFCNHIDGITRGGGNPHYWQDDPWIDPNNVVTLQSGARVAVLDYGRIMRAGDMDCSVQPDGLTCQAAGSGHGFTVNSGSYSTW